MLSYCTDLLSLFLVPMQDFVMGSVFAVFLLVMLVSSPFLLLSRFFRIF